MLSQMHQQHALDAEERLGTRLAGNVNDVVRVGEAIELRGRALGVRAHLLKVEPVADVERLGELGALGDAVDAVAGRAPDRVLDALGGDARLRGLGVVERLSVAAQDLGNGVLVVKHDVGKVAIHTVVDVEHVALAAERFVLDIAAGNHVAGNGKGRCDVVSAGLGNNVDARGGGEVLVESAGQDTGHDLETGARKAAADIKGAHVEAVVLALLEDNVGVTDSLVEGHGVGRARAHVEADANNVEAKLLGEAEEALGGVHGSTKLHAETADAGGIIGDDAEEEVSLGEVLGNLVELVGIVKGHLPDASGLDVAHVRVGLARLGIDDAVGGVAEGEDLVNLRLGGAVKAGAEGREEAQDHGVGVALDGCGGVSV